MTRDQARGKVRELDDAAGRAVLAVHAFEDAPDAPGRIIAARALQDAVRVASRVSHELERELRVLGVSL